MDRRDFLAGAPLAAASIAAAVGMTGCMRRTIAPPSAAGMAPANLLQDLCQLPPVHISRDRVIRTVVGLRPYRPSGFRVEREQIGDTDSCTTMGMVAAASR
jgi:D-amino-acid oxidase